MFTRAALQARTPAALKTLRYRLFMVLITNAIAWLVVGDVDGAMNVGVVTSLQKTGTYSEHHSPVTLDDLIRYCQ